MHDSPIARGNHFNQKSWREKWYPTNEVRLDNGKFIDSYDPFKKEIISRKATELNDIDIATYRKYLKELKTKYAPPKTISTKKKGFIYDLLRKSPDLPNDAKMILEIPESNKNFSEIEEYKKIANKIGIQLRFKPE